MGELITVTWVDNRQMNMLKEGLQQAKADLHNGKKLRERLLQTRLAKEAELERLGEEMRKLEKLNGDKDEIIFRYQRFFALQYLLYVLISFDTDQDAR
jgi:predicted nuclease with TOPRIM domain